MLVLDIVEQVVEGFYYYWYVLVQFVVVEFGVFFGDQCVVYCVDVVGIGDGDWGGQQVGFVDLFQVCGVVVVVEYMVVGEVGLQVCCIGVWLDQGDVGVNLFVVDLLVQGVVVDVYVGNVGDCVEWVGSVQVEGDVKLLSVYVDFCFKVFGMLD